MFPSKIPFSDLPSFNRGAKLFDAFVNLVCVIDEDKRAELEKEVDLVLSSPDYCKALAAKSALAAKLVQRQIFLMNEVVTGDMPVMVDLVAA